MQATLDASALKPFTRSLTCISRYGDELSLHATAQTLNLSTTNSSKSAYTRFKYDKAFFQKYSVEPSFEEDGVTSQLLVKSLLSILRHRAVDKTVEKCELSIKAGSPSEEEEEDQEEDGLESKLVVVFHCKHGVIKTHRLLLSNPTSLMSPGVPDSTCESLLTVGPKAIKDMVEHFPLSRGHKSDSQLVWTFNERDVEVKTLASSIDAKGKSHLSTSLSISAEEFDVYDLYAAPTVILFHLGEFTASIAFAESMSVILDMRFTSPAAPLYIDIEGDGYQALFVISTSQSQNAPSPSSQKLVQPNRKRPRAEQDEEAEGSQPREAPRFKKPMKVVQVQDMPQTPNRNRGSMPPPPLPSQLCTPPTTSSSSPQGAIKKGPLFYPSASQSSQALIDLGLEDMTAEDVQMMLDVDIDDDLLEDSFPDPGGSKVDMMVDEDDMTIEATQTHLDDSKTFKPLFDD